LGRRQDVVFVFSIHISFQNSEYNQISRFGIWLNVYFF